MVKYSKIIWDRDSKQWVKLGSSESAEVIYRTTAEWNERRSEISKLNVMYVYTDYKTEYDENNVATYIPGIKLGDGKAYVANLPFITGDYGALEQNLSDHIQNGTVHITQEERDFWNRKSRAVVDGENLILTSL